MSPRPGLRSMFSLAAVVVFLVAFWGGSLPASAETRGGSPTGDGSLIESHTGHQDRSRIVDKLRRELPGHDGPARALFVDPRTVVGARLDFVANLRALGPKGALFERSRDPEMVAPHWPGDGAHGVGAALMWLADYDVPPALDACRLSVKTALAYYCATGAYMAYVTERDSEDAKSRSLLYPCDTFEYPTA